MAKKRRKKRSKKYYAGGFGRKVRISAKVGRKYARKTQMPEAVIRKHALRLKKNPRARKIYEEVLSR